MGKKHDSQYANFGWLRKILKRYFDNLCLYIAIIERECSRKFISL